MIIGVFINDFTTKPGKIMLYRRKPYLISPERINSNDDRRVTWGSGNVPNSEPVTHEQKKAVFEALDDLCKIIGDARLLVVLFPRDWQISAERNERTNERQRVVVGWCRRQNIEYIDLLDNFHKRPIKDYFRPGDDVHPHAEAAEEIAKIIASRL